MKRLIPMIVKLFIFLAIGECLTRFDSYALLRQGNRTVEIENKFNQSPESAAIEKGHYFNSPKELRIMVLGDSIINGPGVSYEHIFSQQLKNALSKTSINDIQEKYVLDLSKGGHNTFKNHETYFHHVEKFNPKFLVLAYSSNDVYGKFNAPEKTSKKTQTKEKTVEPAIAKIRRLVYNSTLLQFLLVNLNMELKIKGIVLPGSEFHHQITKSHTPDFPGWKKSQLLLKEIIEDCKKRKITLLAYIPPSLEMLENHELFTPVNETITDFFKINGIETIDGFEPFIGLPSKDFAVSRYDGHPNAAAHKIMAQQVLDKIINYIQ